MEINELIERLLYQEEGSSLDFKSAQYRFIGAEKDEKSELLKDILAFANAWRQTDAYIVLGVIEVQGGKSIISGITEKLDDAQLQQFVNGKVNNPVEFSYQAAVMDGKDLALISIPVQSRPIYLNKDYGKLSANTVYIRRGSSTDIALPDEIAKMGPTDKLLELEKPEISAFLVSQTDDSERLVSYTGEAEIATIPPADSFPVYSSISLSDDPHGVKKMMSAINSDNSKYYSEFAAYVKDIKSTCFVKLGVENTGGKVARDVRARLTFSNLPLGTRLVHSNELPREPSKQSFGLTSHMLNPRALSDISISRTSKSQTAEFRFGKIHAKDSCIMDETLYITVSESFSTTVGVEIFSDDLSTPVTAEIMFDITVSKASYDEAVFTRDY